jgi:type IX secretion system PorP/SprF family membrane protein
VKKTILTLTLLIGLCNLAIGQDPRFSQYFTSPLTLNPANTGNFDGPVRLTSNFRNQWQGVGTTVNTGTISAEMALMKDKLKFGDRLSIGFLGLYDNALEGGFSSSFLGPSIGYHIWLDEDLHHKLSIGFQGMLVNKRIDPTRLSFASQFTSGGFNPNLPTFEVFQNQNINYFDWNTGLLYNFSNDESTYYVGVSAYHLTKPSESFFGDESMRVPIRMSYNAGLSRNIGDRGTIVASAMHQRQGQQTETIGGLAYGYFLNAGINELSFYMGGWYRLKESIIPYVGLTFNNLHFGISYDVLTNDMSQSRLNNRSIELSVSYMFKDKSSTKKYIPWY